MLFTTLGEIRRNFYVTGHVACPILIMDGPNPVLFEGGVTYGARIYVEAIEAILGKRQPSTLFFTHAHWDHLGAISYLKDTFPDLKIAASQQAADIIKRPNALALITRLNAEAGKAARHAEEIEAAKLVYEPFRPFTVDIELEDGQILDFGEGITVEVIATPGHTRDDLSYYLPHDKILVAGESAGLLNDGGFVSNSFVYNYNAYMASLLRIAELPIEVLCQGHHMVLVGREEVETFINRSIHESIRYKERIYELLDQENGSIEHVVQRIKEERYDTNKQPKQPEFAYLLNVKAQVAHLADKKAQEQKDK